jgi:selenocysteine lyase/cysteine desulfurase
MAIFGLVREGGRVVTTTLEHNAVLRPLFHLRNQGRIELHLLSARFPGRIAEEELKTALGSDTCLVVVNHASNVTGTIQPIQEISEICRSRGIPMVVDASQSAGAVEIDFTEMPLAVLAFTGHKGLLGPRGTGGLLVGSQLDPAFWKVGGTGIRSDLETMPDMWPLKYEPGTMNHPGIAGLSAAVGFLTEQGIRNFAQKKRDLAIHLCEELNRRDGLSVYAEEPERNWCGVVSFALDHTPTDDMGYILQESFDIRVRTGLHCAPLIHKLLGTFPSGTVRVSFSGFNTHEEVVTLLEAVDTVKGAA